MSNVLLHRVAFKIGTGEDPGQYIVDHVNLVKTDNRLANLRLADDSQSIWNTAKQPLAKGVAPASKYKGVTYVKDRHGAQAYCIARITFRGRRIYLGTFPTEETAHLAYVKAAERLHGEYARWSK
jgi:hypothetical protein